MRPSSSWPRRPCRGTPNSIIIGEPLPPERGGREPPSPALPLFHKLAAAFRKRPECLGRGDRREELVVVPGPLRFVRLLDLEEVHVVGDATIVTHLALAEQRIVRGHFLHFGYDLRG